MIDNIQADLPLHADQTLYHKVSGVIQYFEYVSHL